MFNGIKITKANILSTLENFSIVKIDIKIGDKFDYNLHQAVSMVKDENSEKGVIISILSNGYKIAERILKPAMVVVNS